MYVRSFLKAWKKLVGGIRRMACLATVYCVSQSVNQATHGLFLAE